MNTTLYSDGFANISLLDGVVRLDCVTLTPPDAENKVNVKVVGSMATSLPGLLRMHDQINGLVQKLVEQGVLQRNDKPAGELQAPAKAS
jgi:hypothetical protein